DKFHDYRLDPSDMLWDGIQARGGLKEGIAATMSSYSFSPSDRVWKSISASLHPHRRAALIWWWSSAASIVLLFGFSLWFVNSNNGISHVALQAEGPSISIPKREVMTEPDMSAQSVSSTSENAVEQVGAYDSIVSNRSSKEQNDVASDELAYSTDESAENQSETNGNSSHHVESVKDHGSHGVQEYSQIPSHGSPMLSYTMPQTQLKSYPFIPPPQEALVEVEEDRWVLMAAVSPYGGSNDLSVGNNAVESSNSFAGAATQDLNTTEESDVFTAVAMNVHQENDLEFNPPVSFGGMIVGLNDRVISPGGGFQYTVLSGSVSSTYEEFETRQSFVQHYLGIPFFAEVDLIRKEKFALYSRLGGQFDFGVKSSTHVVNLENSTANSEYRYSFKPSNQWSGVGGFGARVSITDRMGIYMEGTANYMLPSQSTNLWSQRKVWPKASVGVRFGF
ncbi:MAG: hypothetical protein HKN32_01770, partial [Flavobacteriales bacterium]|nr:hypothetical protein [Flavobacteriales bacterium]